jgi:hypothetical protein
VRIVHFVHLDVGISIKNLHLQARAHGGVIILQKTK